MSARGISVHAVDVADGHPALGLQVTILALDGTGPRPSPRGRSGRTALSTTRWFGASGIIFARSDKENHPAKIKLTYSLRKRKSQTISHNLS